MYVLSQDTQVPLYVQLYDQIRADVLSGKLPSHSRPPSVRELSVELSASRNTVENAYQELLAEGYLYSKPRSGFFVSALDQELGGRPPARPPRPTARVRERLQPRPYDFHPARLCPESFPAPTWRKLFAECLNESPQQFSDYRDPQGEWGLRCALQSYLERSRGVVCAPEQIVVCSGLQQSLDIVAQLVKGRTRRIGVEDPGYYLPREVFLNRDFEVVPLPVGASGLEIAPLKASGCSVVYVTPSHQFPTGRVMPIARRLQLIEWAEAGGGIILEDDYDSELRYQGKPIPSLQGLRPQGNIVYLGTISKVLSPALRMSYLVLPQALLDRYRTIFRGFFGTVSLLEQRTLAKFMEQGFWDRHLRRMRTIYKKKHDALLRAIEQHFGPRVEVTGQGAGLHVVLRLVDQPLGEQELIERAAGKGVTLFPFSKTCAGGHTDSANIMLGFGGMDADELTRGVELLRQAWY